MAIVHTSSQSGSAVTSHTTPALDTTGMTLLIVGTANYHIGSLDDATPAVTDNKGNTYTKIGTSVASSSGIYSALFYCATPTVGTGHTFTYSVLSAQFIALAVLGSDGIGASPLDQGSNSSFSLVSGTVLTTPSISTTQASELLVVVYADDDGANTVALTNGGSGSATWTKDEDHDGSAGQRITLGHATVSATGAYAATFTSNTGAWLAAGIVSFKLSGATTNTRTATPVTVALSSTPTRTATPVTAALSLAGQHGFPISDGAVGLWTTQASGTTNLYQTIDETSPDDADYVQSPQSPNVLTTYAALERQTYGQLEQRDYAALESTSDYYQARLTSLSTPVSGTRTLRYRYSKDAGTERIDLQIDLYQGATLVQSWTHTDISTTWTQANQSVTGTVTDYTDLHVRLTATQV